MYLDFFGLKQKPFENAPNPEFFYFSPEHEEAYTRLIYAVTENKGGAMLSGEYGCGKTTLIRVLVDELSESKYDIALINNPRWSAIEMLKDIIYQFGSEPVGTTSQEYSQQLGQILFNNLEAGRQSLIVVDESQLITSEEVFEELRLIMNFQLNDSFLVTILMAGQPDLREKVIGLPQLEQRLAVKSHLYNLDMANTINYIAHRIKVGGGEENFFSESAIELVYQVSHGTPRRINNICDMSLMIAKRKGLKKISPAVVKSAI